MCDMCDMDPDAAPLSLVAGPADTRLSLLVAGTGFSFWRQKLQFRTGNGHCMVNLTDHKPITLIQIFYCFLVNFKNSWLGCDAPFNKHLFFVSSKYWCVKKSYRKLNLWLANGLVIKNTRQNSKACWNIICQISCYYEMKCKHCVRSREENTFQTAPGPDSWPRDKVKTLWRKSNWMRLTRSVPDSLTVSRLSSATDSEARAAWTR